MEPYAYIVESDGIFYVKVSDDDEFAIGPCLTREEAEKLVILYHNNLREI